jgi:hypothetical protein
VIDLIFDSMDETDRGRAQARIYSMDESDRGRALAYVSKNMRNK